MHKKLTWFLTMLALALFGFIFFFERKAPSTAERTAAPRLLSIDAQEVVALEIKLDGGGTVRAEQTNGTWYLTKPAYPAQQSIIEMFVTNLVQLRGFDKLAQHEVVIEGQKSFGLDPPRAVVEVETATNRYELEVGGTAPLTNNIYVRMRPSTDVLLTQADLLRTLPKHTNDWRSRRLLQLASIPFDHLQVRAGQRFFELMRNPTNRAWQISRPIPARGDQYQISALLDLVGRAQIGKFVADGSADLETYGLQSPQVELGFNQGTNRIFTVEFGGSSTNETNTVFARLVGNTNLVTVSQELVDFLKQPYQAFHDPRLFTLNNPGALDKIEITFLEDFAVHRQADGRWMVGENVPADLELLGEFISKVLALRIVDIVKEVPTEADLQALGLRKPIASYSFFERMTNGAATPTNSLMATLSFGTNTADRIYASRSDETPVYLTEFAKFLELPRYAYELRDRLIWNYTTGNVTRVTLSSAGGTNSATRTGPNWSADPLANEAIGEAVFRLSHLKALRWVTQGEERKQSFGIVPGTEILEVELKTDSGTEVWRIHLGKLTMRRDIYAEHPRVPGLIFEFPGEIYHLLKQNLPAAK